MNAGLNLSQQIDMTMYMVAHDHGLRLDGPISSQHSHVFKAVDEHGNRHVLKSARSSGSLAHEVSVIEALAEIPGVFLPHTITRYKGRIFFIFDYVKTLDEVITQGTRLPLLYKLIYMQHATQTVARIHELGYVHKDLTTKNLYPDDTMLVGDLGDAGVEGELVTGVADELRTSIGYFSPLEYDQETKMQFFTRNADLFQLCMVLFQWITMKPYKGLVGNEKAEVIDPYYIIDHLDEFRFDGGHDEYSLLRGHEMHDGRFLSEMGKQYPRSGTVIQDIYEFIDLVYQAMYLPELCPTMGDLDRLLTNSIESLQRYEL